MKKLFAYSEAATSITLEDPKSGCLKTSAIINSIICLAGCESLLIVLNICAAPAPFCRALKLLLANTDNASQFLICISLSALDFIFFSTTWLVIDPSSSITIFRSDLTSPAKEKELSNTNSTIRFFTTYPKYLLFKTRY